MLQALDVINALEWALRETGVSPQHTPLLTLGEGTQVGAMLLKLFPDVFSSLLDLSGVAYGASKAAWLARLLEDPYQRQYTGDQRKAAIGNSIQRFRDPLCRARRDA